MPVITNVATSPHNATNNKLHSNPANHAGYKLTQTNQATVSISTSVSIMQTNWNACYICMYIFIP